MSELQFAKLQIEHRDQAFNLSFFKREAGSQTLLYLHGMGSSKHDFLHAGVRIYADRFRNEISERVALDYSNSLVRSSDGDDLLSWCTELSMPRLFVYGSANAHLSYLGRLRRSGVCTVEVPHSHHWVL